MHGLGSLLGNDVEVAGRTDASIMRDVVRLAGVDDAVVDERWPEVQVAAVAAYDEIVPDLSERVAPGVVELLEALTARPDEFRLALLTGNIEPIARRKLAAAGIGHHFEPGQGGFGSDHHNRAKLPAIARERAGDWPRERTVVIGDTPRDIACARADDIRVAAVATGHFTVEQLADADAVADDARALLPILETWQGGGQTRTLTGS